MPDGAGIWIMRRANLLHPNFLQHSGRAIWFGERMSVNPFDVRMGKRIINETLSRFRCQTATSVGRNNRVTYFNHARFISFAPVPTYTNQHIVFGVNKKVRPPQERVRVSFQIFMAELYRFDARDARKIKPIIVHSDAEHLLELLLVR